MKIKTYNYIYQISKWFSIVYVWISFSFIIYCLLSNKNIFYSILLFINAFLPYAIIHGWFVQCVLWKFVVVDSYNHNKNIATN